MAYNAGSVVVDIGGDTKGFDTALGGVLGGFANLRNVALGVGAAVAGALVGVARYGIKSFAEFDAAMTKSTAIMGDLSDTMRDRLETAAREVAKTTSFSATQAAEALYFLSSAGLEAEHVVAALPTTAKFAQAGMFDLATATEFLTSAQASLGLKTGDAAKDMENMTRVANALVQADNMANASIEEFAEALTNKAAAAMRNANIELEEGVAVLAAFSEQGLRGQRAGQAFAIVLNGIEKASRNNAKAWDDLGLSIYNVDGSMRNMADIIGDLETAFSGMTVEQQNAALASLGLDQRAADYLKTLIGTSDGIREYEKALRDAGGIMDEVSSKQLMTFSERWGLVQAKLKDVAMSVGEALMPHLERLVQWIDDNSDTIGNVLVGLFEGVAWVVGKVSAAFGVLLDVTKAVFSSDSQTRMEGMIGVYETFGIKGVEVVTKLREAWDGFKSFIAELAPKVEELFGRTFEVIGTILGDIVSAFAKGWNDIEDDTDESWGDNGILGAIGGFLTSLIDGVILPTLAAIEQFWDEHGDRICEIVEIFGGFLSENFRTIMSVLAGILTLGMQIMSGDWEGAWETIKDIGVMIWDQINSNMQTIMGVLGPAILRLAMELMKSIIQAAWEAIKTWVGEKLTSIKDTIRSKVGEWPGAAKSALSNLGSMIAAPFIDAYNTAVSWVGKIRSVVASLDPFKRLSPAPADVILAGWKQLNDALDRTLDYTFSSTVQHVGDVRGQWARGYLSPCPASAGVSSAPTTTINIDIHGDTDAGQRAADALLTRCAMAGVVLG